MSNRQSFKSLTKDFIMYDWLIAEMSKALIDAGLISEDKDEEIQKVIQKVWEHRIAIVWNSQDIIEYAEQMDMKIDEEAADEILEDILHHHDCNYGVTWDTISYHIKDKYVYESKIRMTPFEELPTIINDIKTEEGKRFLQKRLKEGK